MWIAQMFRAFALTVSDWTGRPLAFAIALACVIVWAATGPLLGYSEAWQLTINTATTIVTFLMVFLIQNSQNCDTKAIQIKLDELIRVTRGAENTVIDVETLSEEEIELLAARYSKLATTAREVNKKNGGNGIDLIELITRKKKTSKRSAIKPRPRKSAATRRSA